MSLWLSALLLAVATADPTGSAASDAAGLAVYTPTAVAVSEAGRTSFDLNGAADGRVYWLVVGALGKTAEKHHVEFRIKSTGDRATSLPLCRTNCDESWSQLAASRRREMRQRRSLASDETYTVARIAETRSFHLFVKEADFLDNSGYQEVHARLAACGDHCLIYLDVDDWNPDFLKTTVAESVQLFDKTIYPKARELFGNHLDVDRNGKFTILFTHLLGQLSGGKVSLGGFVRGADFYRDVEPPLSNRCDMLYLNTNIKPGSNLRTLLAHEYTHAITFSEHVFGHYLADSKCGDDEAWLSEAIAHLAENLIGKGYSNLDHRVSTYLTAPERYRLVVPDYYRAGLWRCHGCRGATYLFLRWIVDRYGEGVLKELSQSNLAGIENIETATQTPFDELFRNWCISTLLAGLESKSTTFDYATLNLHSRLESRQLSGPNVRLLESSDCSFDIAATAMLPVEIRVAPGSTKRIAITAPNDSQLQITVVRMPDDLPQIRLVATRDSELARSVRLKVEQRAGAQVRWQNAAWELAFPPQNKAPESQTGSTVMACPELFTKLETRSGQAVFSDPIDISRHGGRSVVVKVSGIDAKGRRVAGWTVVPAENVNAND